MNSATFRLLAVLLVLAVAGYFVAVNFLGNDDEADVPAATVKAPPERPATPDRTVEAPTVPAAAAPPEETERRMVAGSTSAADGAVVEVGKGTGGLSGSVRTQAGDPVADAEVRLLIGHPNIQFALPASRKKTNRTAVTDSDGSFHFEDLPANPNYVVVAEHADFAQGESSGNIVREDDMCLVPDIILTSGARVYGVVRDVNGGLIPNAAVQLWNTLESNFQPAENKKPWKETTSDAGGAYEFKNVHFNAMEVAVSAPNYATASKSDTMLFTDLHDRELNFDLSTALSIGGVVLDVRGAPVRDAHVDAYQIGQPQEAGSSKGSTASNPDGSFTLTGLAEGTYNLSARAQGYSDVQYGQARAGDTNVRIQLEPRGGISGVVVDGRSGQPVQEFTLRLCTAREGGDPIVTAKSISLRSSDGSFEFPDVDPGSYVLEGVARDYAPSHSASFFVERGQVTPKIQVPMKVGGRIAGIVVAPTGEPVAGAVVKLNANNFRPNPVFDLFASLPSPVQRREDSTTTDENGAFVLRYLAGGTFTVEVAKSRYSTKYLDDVIVADGDQRDLGRVVLSNGGKVAGKCLDETGRPFSDGSVTCSNAKGQSQTVRPDIDGRFEIPSLEPGAYDLILSPDKKDGAVINPLMKIIYAQKTKTPVEVQENAVVTVTLQLPPMQK